MIAPNVPGPMELAGWREKHARRIVNLSPAVLSSFGKQYNNRRVFSGFSLAEPFRAAHLNGKHLNVRYRNGTAIEIRKRIAIEIRSSFEHLAAERRL